MNWYREFERCLNKRWLVRMPEARYLVIKELDVAHDDLAESEAGYERGSYKWSTIQSYYAMFHAARALREEADYRAKFSPTSAQHNLKAARGMVDQVSELLTSWYKKPDE